MMKVVDMFVELLIIFLIIIILPLIFLLFKPLDIHIILQNDNLDYSAKVNINFLFFNFLILYENSEAKYLFNLYLFSKKYSVYSFNFDLENNETEDDTNDFDETDIFKKIEEILPKIDDAKEDIFELVYLLKEVCKFKNSEIYVNLGLSDNNLTIKCCNLLWSIFAPLYVLDCRLLLTPEINKLILKTDLNIRLKIFLRNILKIIFTIIVTKSLNDLVRAILK